MSTGTTAGPMTGEDLMSMLRGTRTPTVNLAEDELEMLERLMTTIKTLSVTQLAMLEAIRVLQADVEGLKQGGRPDHAES